MKIVFIILLFFVYFIQAFTLSLAGKPNKQVILENTIEKEYLQQPEILSLSQKYRHTMFGISGIFSVLTLGITFLNYDSLIMSAFWFFLLTSTLTMFLTEIKYIRKMRDLLAKNSWGMTIQPVLVDTKLVMQKNKKIVSAWWFLPPTLFWLLGSSFVLYFPPIEGGLILFLVSGLTLAFSIGGWYFVSKLPVRPMTNNRESNQKANDLTKHHWSFMMITIGWFILPILFIPTMSLLQSVLLETILTGIIFVLLTGYLIFTFWYLYSLRIKQDELLKTATGYRYYGDDEYWRFGFYINPNDTRFFIPDRIGLNMGINLGRPIGKILAGLTAILLFGVLLATLIPFYLYDFSDNAFQLNQTETTVTISAPFTRTVTIDLENIREVTLVDELSANRQRNFGTATDNYATGHFTVEGRPANLYVDYHSQPILFIRTKERDYYYTNKNSAKTIATYEELTKKLE